MKLMLEFWGEHRDFALGEVRSILEGEGIGYSIVEEDYPVAVVDVENWTPLKRAGLVRYISEHLSSSDELPYVDLKLDNFAVRARRYFGKRDVSTSEIERKVGKMIAGRVNLENPGKVVRVAVSGRFHMGIMIHDFNNEGFEARRPTNMPISFPITMHPRYTRALINIASLKSGAKILDPFCGTGMILLEASLMGMNPVGSDIDPRMVNASKLNLRKFGIKAKVELRDVGEIEGRFDAIVTDPPYGRSSSSKGEEIKSLYHRAFERFGEVTDRVAVVLPSAEAVKIAEQFFTLKSMYAVRVHKSLTRYYCSFKR